MLAVLLLNRMFSVKHRISRRDYCEIPIKSDKTEKEIPALVYCRTCLATDDLQPIFIDKDAALKRSQELKLVTGLDIKMNDTLPQKICSQCLNTIHMALQFRRTSRKVEKNLISLLAGAKLKRRHSRLRSLKGPKVKKAKIVKVEPEDYDDSYGDDFQNDNDYVAIKEESSTSFTEVERKPLIRKKRISIPNASSYKCPTCSKEFRMKATYKAHLRFHTDYCVCESCGKRCRNNNQLQEHKRARHGLGRIHKCAYCEYSSATKEALTIHERRHTGERPYVCDHCGATFHRRSNLVQHIAIHLPEKNFQCDMCPKRLKSRKFLQIHKHNAHTGKRYGYLCPICEHRFEKPNKTRAHIRRVHGMPDDQQGPITRVQL